MLKRTWLLATAVLLFLLIVGCSQSSERQSGESGQSTGTAGTSSAVAPPTDTQPVTLKFYMHVLFPDDVFKKFFEEPVKKKFPNVTLELIKKDAKSGVRDDIANLVSTGVVPDIVYTALLHIDYFTELKVPADLNELAKQHSVDLNRYDARMIEGLRKYGTKKELYALPILLSPTGLYYNKDIFDKFAVPYPKDGMTWEETIQLAKRLPQSEGGINYARLAAPAFMNFSSSLALPIIDEKTNKAIVTTDAWVNALRLFREVIEIPGNQIGNRIPQFIKDKTDAMFVNQVTVLSQIQDAQNAGNVLNWDVVTEPAFPSAPGIGRQYAGQVLMVGSSGKHKDLAFQIAAYLSGDEDLQMMQSRDARPTALAGKQFQQSFGSNLPALTGKNIQTAFFKNKPAEIRNPSEYNKLAEPELNKAGTAKVDVNTALREAGERINQIIATAETK
jgi:multiple sugar transport system substrate-binding protein